MSQPSETEDLSAGTDVVSLVVWFWIVTLSLGGGLALIVGMDDGGTPLIAGVSCITAASILLVLVKLVRVAEECLEALRTMMD